MLNKKQILGLMLLLSPMLALSMAGGAGAGAGGGAAGAAAAVEADIDDAADDAVDAAADAAGAPRPSAGFMTSMNNFINNYLNAPLNIALTKISTFGAKSKLLVGVLVAYVGYSASGQIAQDVTTNIPNTVKSVFGADCEDSGCRGGKSDKWTEAA